MRKRSQADERFVEFGFSDAETAVLASTSTVVNVPAGTSLCQEGRRGSQVLWILEGSADVVRSSEVIARVGRTDVVGEMTMIGTRTSCSADVVATTAMTVAAMSRRDWQSARNQAPSLVTKLTEIARARELQLVA